MIQKVYKYPLAWDDRQEIMLPRGAQVLRIDVPAELYRTGTLPGLFLWALVNPDAETAPRTIRIAGTGHPIDDSPLEYIDTVMLDGGSLVFHVFEVVAT